MAASPIGLMNHITMSTPDVPAAKRFWIDFLGGEWYSESFRLIQVLIGGILVDFFPPLDPKDEEAIPAPGSLAQRFRFAISPEQVSAWLARAETWQVRTALQVQEELLRLALVFEAPGGYRVALEARYASREALRAAEQEHTAAAAWVAAISATFTADRVPGGVRAGSAPGANSIAAPATATVRPAGDGVDENTRLERAVAAAEAGIYQLGYQVRAGMLQTEALSILEAALLRAGVDPGHQTVWESGPAPQGDPGPALPVPLQRFDVILAELTPKYGGSEVRELHPICVGKPDQRVYELFELDMKVFEAALALLTPGRSLDELTASADQAGLDSPHEVTLRVASAGHATDALTPNGSGSAPLRDGQVLTLYPIARAEDGTTIGFATTVRVTPDGGRRLGSRPLELMLTSRSFLSAYTEWCAPEPTAPWLAPS